LQPIQKANKEEINLKDAATKAEFETIMTGITTGKF
jgi:hypothetical protein